MNMSKLIPAETATRWQRVVPMAIAALCTALPSFADGIRWEHAKNIAGDADVRTDGVLRYAYANKAATVNGVPFAAGVNKNGFPDGVATMADVGLNVASQYIDSDHFATTVPAGASVEYLQLIRAGMYSTSAAGGTVTNTVTLKNLIPGHAYIVQLWTNDSRSNPGDIRYIKIDGTEVLRLRTSSGFGQHITGAFTATGDSQSFTIVGCNDRSDSTGVSQFASLQLRDVTPGQIAWEDAKNITDDNDVRLDGECVFAAGWSATTATVNGVVFVPLANTNQVTAGGCVYEDVRMAMEIMSWYRTATFNTDITQTLSDDYHRLMGGATYPSIDATSTVTLKGLAPGGRYLVQLWVNDTRTTIGPYRWQEIDGGRRMAFAAASGTYGQHITGVFTAEGASKSLKITSLYKPTSKVTNGNPQINAIQLRRLDSGAATHWRVSPITKRDYDVRLDGELMYAYNFTTDTTDAEVNGVTFKGYHRTKVLVSSNDDIELVFPSVGNDNASTFGITDNDMSAGYRLMIQSATYPGGGSTDATPSTLTLKRLTPGHRYLVQLWAHDGRSGAKTGDRYMTLDGVARVEYKNEDLFSPARGDVATGIFTATAATKMISMLSGHHSDLANRSVQINGMQVRDLGPAADSAYNVWTGGASGAWGEDATNWSDLAGEPREGTLWDAADGGTNTALFAAAASAAPSQDLTVDGIVANGALTVGADNDGKGVAAGFVEAQSCAFKSAWTSGTLAKYDLGSFTLDGASPNLSTVVAGAGALTLSRADALKAGADVVVAADATLTLVDGAAPALSRLAGEGTLAFSGTVTLTNESTQAFNGTLDGDVLVRKAGYGDWTLGGTHTGTLALDALEGTTILATDGAAISIAEGAAVSLGGATRSLGAVSGQGTITNGTVSTALAVSDGSDITLGAVTLSAGVTLNGASSVTFAGDKDLTGVSVYVADPAAASASRKAVVAVEGEMSGEPSFTFGTRGYKAKLAEGGNGYVVSRAGFMVIVR